MIIVTLRGKDTTAGTQPQKKEYEISVKIEYVDTTDQNDAPTDLPTVTIRPGTAISWTLPSSTEVYDTSEISGNAISDQFTIKFASTKTTMTYSGVAND